MDLDEFMTLAGVPFFMDQWLHIIHIIAGSRKNSGGIQTCPEFHASSGQLRDESYPKNTKKSCEDL